MASSIKAGMVGKKAGKTPKIKLPTASTPSMHDQMHSMRQTLMDALVAKKYVAKEGNGVYPGIEDVYKNTVVFYEKYSDLMACNFEMKDGTCCLGPKTAVERRTVYVPKG